MLTLVRHAHAGDKARWKSQDADRPLSARGWQQAAGIAQNLSGLPGPRLVASPFLRCHQTLLPLATLFGRPIEHLALLGPGADPARLCDALDDPAFDGAVVCTHGETLSSLLLVWASRLVFEDSAGQDASARGSTEKGAAWIIVADGRQLRAHYVRPLLIGARVLSESWEAAAG